MGILSNDSVVVEEKVRVKVSLGTETRRASAPLPTFAALYELTRALFHSKDHLVFTYFDDTGDKITMSSDIELTEALRISSSLPSQTLILVAVVQPKEDGKEAEEQVQLTTQEYGFFHQYTVPRGVFGKFSSISGDDVDGANKGAEVTHTIRVHRVTMGTMSPVDSKPTEEIEIDMVEVPPMLTPCAPLSPLSTASLLLSPSVSVPPVGIPTSTLPPLSLPPLPILSTLPVPLTTPVVAKQQPQQRPAASLFDSGILNQIDDLDLYRVHKEYKEKKRALKKKEKKDFRKKELAKREKHHNRKTKDHF